MGHTLREHDIIKYIAGRGSEGCRVFPFLFFFFYKDHQRKLHQQSLLHLTNTKKQQCQDT